MSRIDIDKYDQISVTKAREIRADAAAFTFCGASDSDVARVVGTLEAAVDMLLAVLDDRGVSS